MSIKDMIIATIIAGLLMWIGAVGHEGEMARNFYKTGDAKAWFYEIRR